MKLNGKIMDFFLLHLIFIDASIPRSKNALFKLNGGYNVLT